MVLRLLAAAAAAVLLAGPAPAADPQLTGLVMPDARVLAGINFDQARTSPFGQYVLARIQQNETGLQQFLDATGFDPRQDMGELLVASTGQASAGAHPSGLALVRGTFDVERIASAARAKGGVVETVDGATVLSGLKKGGVVAFVGQSVAVAGDEAQVRAALARRNAPTSLDAALAVRVNRLSTTQDAWVISLVPPPAGAVKLQDPVLQAIQETSAGVKFGANVDVTAEAVAATEQDALSLATVARFLAAMAGANAQGAPAVDLLKSLTVAPEGRTVRLSLSIPEAQLEALLDAPKRRPARRRL